MPHRARPGAAHLLGRAPAALDDDERIEELLLPIAPAARLAPGERRQTGDHRPHLVLLHLRVAVCGLDAPYSEHHAALDSHILLDAAEQAGIFLGLLLAG